jgi:pimeloyl-ACP methyl ester carboxylesterase
MKKFAGLLLWILYLSANIAFGQRPGFLLRDSIRSSLDGNMEVFYYDKSTSTQPAPLLVQLHSWSTTSHSTFTLAEEARAKKWNFILPNFRGVNQTPKACCSDFAIADIDEAIDWAIKHLNVDTRRIFVVGVSGGGYATFAMYMKSRHKIHSFSAWCGISDLSAWYWQSLERKNKYATDIIHCTDAGDTFNEEKAKDRSPLFWNTPTKQRRKSILQIYVGIHDGYSGSVPISQSIHFYNKLLKDYNEKNSVNYVSPEDLETMLQTQRFSPADSSKKVGGRLIHYQKSSKHISLTVFEGGHEILSNVALDLIKL